MLRPCVLGLSQRKRPSRTPDTVKLLYGKRTNAVHRASQSKPPVDLVLLQTPDSTLPNAVVHAVRMNELDHHDILSVLKKHRALRRMDRTLLLLRGLKHAGVSLGQSHYVVLMAHANDRRDTKCALAFWDDAAKHGKVSDQLRGALLAAYRNDGNWSEALRQCAGMWEDKHVLDPYALHTVMNACRRYGPWSRALEVFSKAVEHGTRPNAVVYMEMLRALEGAVAMPNRWQYSLAILEALQDKIDLSAGHYNAVLATMSSSHQWETGVRLFHRMKETNVLPSKATLHALMMLHSHDVAHCVRCLAQTHALSMPVSDTIYRAILTNLFHIHLDHEASRFAEREYKQDVEAAGGTSSVALPLSVAMLDSLLAHPRPRDALLFYQSFEHKLGDVVGAATRGLGTLGLINQRWLVQGRVAVIDHNVLLATTFESLVFHYDAIIIPFACVRLLVRRMRDSGASRSARYAKTVLFRLQQYLKEDKWSMIRVMPFAHQLLAHTYLDGGPTTPESLQQLREEVHQDVPLLGRKLLERISATEEYHGGLTAMATGGTPRLIIRSPHDGVGGDLLDPITTSGSQEASSESLPSRGSPLAQPSFLSSTSRITSTERVVAVAVMLKVLNREADVHLLSTNPTQVRVVERWNHQHPTTPLTALLYPKELHDKAPAQTSGKPTTPLT